MKPIGTSDAARRLRVTPSRVIALIRAKRLKATRIGGAWIIDPKDLKAVMHRKPGRPRKTKSK